MKFVSKHKRKRKHKNSSTKRSIKSDKIPEAVIEDDNPLESNIQFQTANEGNGILNLFLSNIKNLTEASTKSTRISSKNKKKKGKSLRSNLACNSPSTSSIPTTTNNHYIVTDLKSIQEEKINILVVNHKRNKMSQGRKKSGTQTLLKIYQ